MVCSHIENATLNLPSAFTQVHKDECTQCFDSQVMNQRHAKSLEIRTDAKYNVGWT